MVRVTYKPEGKNSFRQILMHRPELESAWDYVSHTMRENTIIKLEILGDKPYDCKNWYVTQER